MHDLLTTKSRSLQPAQLMAAAALLWTKKEISDEDVDRIANVCRCGTHSRIRQAIKSAAAKM